MKKLDVPGLRSDLLCFYDSRRRDLPWRRDTDPYRVWVSEIMLQQTRARAAIPYYERWLARFPDLDALADAGTDAVLSAWQGLGYYSRARNLHRAACIVRDRLGGSLPRDAVALRSLPGIGDYTAGAIASIAFGQREPAVDGNVRRVLARILDLEDRSDASIRVVASELVPADRPGDFNQALMELGATICLPRAPRCGDCPIRTHCSAHANGTQLSRPSPRRTPTIPAFEIGSAVVQDARGTTLLQRRPERGLLAGLWCFPGKTIREGERPADAARRAARAVLAASVRPGRAHHLLDLTHNFTHRRETYRVYRFRVKGEAPALPEDAVWCADTATLAMSAATRRILEHVKTVDG